MAQDPMPNYKNYPRSESWQVASVLNPSLQNSLPASRQSRHARDKRERLEIAAAAAGEQSARIDSCTAASKPWQEESLPLPPQYVSPGALCKAMPKYMRVKARHDQMQNLAIPAMVTTTTTATSCSPGNHIDLPFSPHYDLAIGSPRSDHSSGKLTPRSVLDSPKQATVTFDATSPQQTIKLASDAACSPASQTRSPDNAPVAAARASPETTTSPVSAPHQNTPQTQSMSSSRSSLLHNPCASRRHTGAQSSRIRSAATSPMHPMGGGSSRGRLMDETALQWKLNSTIAQHPELLQRVVPQMQSAAQESPLRPANSCYYNNNNACKYSSPPVALPPTPPTSGRQQQQQQQRRDRNPHPQEPTLETYQKISPNTYATNTVWNDRRDRNSRDRDPTEPRRTILIKSN